MWDNISNVTAEALWILSSHEEADGTWSGVFRLVMLSAMATGGTMGSIFLISAVTVVEPFQVIGNVYLVNLALANLLVTAFVLPSACVAILSNTSHELATCQFQWLVTIVCFLASVQSFMFMAIDNCLGLGSLVTYGLCCTKARICVTIVLIWVVSIGFAVGQYIMDYGPSFCSTKTTIWPTYHITAGVVLVALPVLLTVFYFSGAVVKLRSFKNQLVNLEDPTAYVLTDEFLLKSNLVVFVAMMSMWVPWAVVTTINDLSPLTRHLQDTSWWVAISNSCIYSYLYAATNRDFREAFNKLFYYCCCKSHVTFSRRSRENRQGVGLRVHIIPGLNIYAQRKETTRDCSHVKGMYDL